MKFSSRKSQDVHRRARNDKNVGIINFFARIFLFEFAIVKASMKMKKASSQASTLSFLIDIFLVTCRMSSHYEFEKKICRGTKVVWKCLEKCIKNSNRVLGI